MTIPDNSGHVPTIPPGALDFLKRSPVFITAQAYRDQSFDADELKSLKNHLDSWREILFKHGVIYDGIALKAGSSEPGNLIYHIAMAINPEAYPAAYPLVLDALYDLIRELPAADWQIYGIEQVVTRFEIKPGQKTLCPGQRLFTEIFAAGGEDAQLFP